QNPTSTAYGIPQFLDSTWKSTGIAKTSDGYRQIDAGLIYIENRYGSPCGAWAHSQSTGWY
ncbi:MAG TPA: lytic transglycosylase domain-containing protein, partial [Geodermatophilus sp.]|nr:lytic transglycosylase domain-containing protein [Geodermatophilus sp.]